jgi:hypothetical protein
VAAAVAPLPSPDLAKPPAPAAVPPTPWIVSRRYDSVFFSGSVAVPLVLWWAFSYGIMTGVAVYATFQLLFNMPHNVQTWTMSVFDGADRAKNGRRYAAALGIIVLLFGGTMVLSPTGIYPWLRDALVYWGYYHLVRQHYGFQRLYERRMSVLGSPPSPRESKLYARLLDVVSYAPLLLRFRDPELMTIRVADRAIHIRHPVLPDLAWKAVLVVYVACIAAALVHHVVCYVRGRRHMLARGLLLASVTVAFGLAGLAIDDIIVAIAVVTSFHNIQYLGLTYFHNRTRAELAEREGLPRGTNRPIDWLRAGRVLPYLGMTFGYGLLIFAPRIGLSGVMLAELPITAVVALHYYVDARIWKFNEYPNLARYLRLRP